MTVYTHDIIFKCSIVQKQCLYILTIYYERTIKIIMIVFISQYIHACIRYILTRQIMHVICYWICDSPGFQEMAGQH